MNMIAENNYCKNDEKVTYKDNGLNSKSKAFMESIEKTLSCPNDKRNLVNEINTLYTICNFEIVFKNYLEENDKNQISDFVTKMFKYCSLFENPTNFIFAIKSALDDASKFSNTQILMKIKSIITYYTLENDIKEFVDPYIYHKNTKGFPDSIPTNDRDYPEYAHINDKIAEEVHSCITG